MVVASHYIIRDILELLDRRDLKNLRATCEDHRNRYCTDKKLCELCDEIIKCVDSGKEKDLEKLKPSLKELLSLRKVELSGEGSLWFRDLR